MTSDLHGCIINLTSSADLFRGDVRVAVVYIPLKFVSIGAGKRGILFSAVPSTLYNLLGWLIGPRCEIT